MNEADIQARIMLKLGALPGTRVFRNTVGEGWQGKVVEQTRDVVVIQHARYVTFGLCVGSSDLIGWHNGRFLAIEVKDLKGSASIQQKKFIAAVNNGGGIAGVARSEDEALLFIR